jgi:NADH dehydrogenase
VGRRKVVVLGGGFGGLYAARALRHAPVDVTLIDKRNFHLFQPLLYQVATAGLSPADIASALRWILRRQGNVRVWMGEVVAVDAAGRRVILRDGDVPFDTLIVATGARHHYFGHDEWESLAPGLKTIEDALDIRRRILSAFEAAEREFDPDRQRALLTFVIVGAGATGVELAGAVAELAWHTLRREVQISEPTRSQILLLDGAERVLPGYPKKLSERCARSLARLGVTVRTNAEVVDLRKDCVTLRTGAATETVQAHTLLWAAGVKASSLGQSLAEATGAELDRAGRVVVGSDLTVPGHPEIFVIGDLSHFAHQTGAPLPGIAPVATAQGRYVAQVIRGRVAGKVVKPFRYRDKGQLATIGRAAAVADFRWIRFSGYLAWLLWLFVHLMYLVGFENRLLVFIRWAWNYFTRNRGARLIAHDRSQEIQGRS